MTKVTFDRYHQRMKVVEGSSEEKKEPIQTESPKEELSWDDYTHRYVLIPKKESK